MITITQITLYRTDDPDTFGDTNAPPGPEDLPASVTFPGRALS